MLTAPSAKSAEYSGRARPPGCAGRFPRLFQFAGGNAVSNLLIYNPVNEIPVVTPR